MTKNDKMLDLAEKELDKTIGNKEHTQSAPRQAYITFEEEEGYQKAIKIKFIRVCCYTKAEKHWHGEPLAFKIASEPSDIIWEN